MNDTIDEMMTESENLMKHIKNHIIEEWRVAESIKETGVSRELFVKAMIQELPRLSDPEFPISTEETFLRVYYDKTPFWCRRIIK